MIKKKEEKIIRIRKGGGKKDGMKMWLKEEKK